MRLIAVLLTGCILFLSCFPGAAQKATATVKHDCCKNMKMACGHSSKEKKPADGCGQPGCAMMFSCSICGFFRQEVLIFQSPVYAAPLQKPVARYITDGLVDYHPDNWKPPRYC